MPDEHDRHADPNSDLIPQRMPTANSKSKRSLAKDTSLSNLQRRYRNRLIFGILALVLIAPRSIIDSQSALSTMFNNPASWLPTTMPVRVQYDSFSKMFGGDELILFGWTGSKVGSPELAAAAAALKPMEQPMADRPAMLKRIVTGDDLIEQMKLPPNRFSDALARNRLRGVVVGPDGETTIMLATFTRDGLRSRRELVPELREVVARAAGVATSEIHIAGPSVDGAIIDHEAFRSIERFTVPSTMLGAVLCVICLRSFLLSAAVLSVALVGQALALAMVAWFGMEMNAILIVLPPLVFVLTASAGIHLSNYYLDTIRSHPGIDPTEATRRAMKLGVVPCWIAATTTVVGLGSLGLVRLWPVSAFGLISATVVVVTLLLLLAILPGTMQLHGRLYRNGELKRGSTIAPVRGLDLFGRVTAVGLNHATLIVVCFAIGTLVCGYGLPQMRTSVNVPRMFPPESTIRVDSQWFEENIGPTVNAEVLIAFAPGAIPDPMDRYMIVRDIDDHIRNLPMIGGVISPRTFLPTPPPPDLRSLSATARKAAIGSQIASKDSPLHQTGYFATSETGEEFWRISFRFPFDEALDYRELFETVRSSIDPELQVIAARTAPQQFAAMGRGVRTIYTGGVSLTTMSQDVLLRDLFRSFLAAFAVVGVMMMFVLRSVRGGLVAMFPNLFPTIAMFGFMGLVQMPLDIGSVMTASVALGIAVDGTVHLLTRFRQSLSTSTSQRQAVVDALQHCGPAMWQTTAVCAISPMVYAMSDFIPTQRFALMMFGLLAAALIGDVILLPAILVSPLGRWFKTR